MSAKNNSKKRKNLHLNSSVNNIPEKENNSSLEEGETQEAYPDDETAQESIQLWYKNIY